MRGLHLFLLLSLYFLYASSSLILVGGGLEKGNAEVYLKIIELSGGPDECNIGIITAASRDPEGSATYYMDLFKHYGVPADRVSWIPIDMKHIENNRNPQVIANISRMTGFFMGGGDQSRIKKSFVNPDGSDSPALTMMRERVSLHNALIGGTSAGCAVMSGQPMISGGESYEACVHGAHSHEMSHSTWLTYDPNGGIGLFPYGFLDTHFSMRGRQGRLIRLVSDAGRKTDEKMSFLGWGVDQDTALVVDDNRKEGMVLGSGGVYLFDLRGATVKQVERHWAILDVKTTFLTRGDRIDMQTLVVNCNGTKAPIQGQEAHERPLSPSQDIFTSYRANGNDEANRAHPREFTLIAQDLFDSEDNWTHGDTYEHSPVYRVHMRKTQATGYVGYDMQLGKKLISFEGLLVDIADHE